LCDGAQVASGSGLPDLLCAAYALSSVYAFVRACPRDGPTNPWFVFASLRMAALAATAALPGFTVFAIIIAYVTALFLVLCFLLLGLCVRLLLLLLLLLLLFLCEMARVEMVGVVGVGESVWLPLLSAADKSCAPTPPLILLFAPLQMHGRFARGFMQLPQGCMRCHLCHSPICCASVLSLLSATTR
jgi:hypothetical protein